LLHLGPRTFPEISGEIVQNAAFTVLNTNPTTISQGVYIRLLDYDQPDQKHVRALEAIRNSSCGWVFNAKQSVFQEIPGKPLAYWLNNKWRSLFKKDTVETVCQLKQGIATGDNDRFLRYWFETSNSSFLKNDISNIERVGNSEGGMATMNMLSIGRMMEMR
jgi:hypothetical protein